MITKDRVCDNRDEKCSIGDYWVCDNQDRECDNRDGVIDYKGWGVIAETRSLVSEIIGCVIIETGSVMIETE